MKMEKINVGNNRCLIRIVLLLTALSFACASPSLKKTANVESNVETQQSRFESDLQTMRTANLKYIFVVRRTDNGEFDGEDKKYLRTNLPTTNRVILSDEDKAFIVGTNYPFPPENLEVLRLRFKVEDYSSERGRLVRQRRLGDVVSVVIMQLNSHGVSRARALDADEIRAPLGKSF